MSDAGFAHTSSRLWLMSGLPEPSPLQGLVQGNLAHDASVPRPALSSPVRPKSGGSLVRKRHQDASTTDQSPESAENWEERDESRIGVKRACNECRQQKLRCDVVQEPFEACSRCHKNSLDCRIDTNFRRVGKRKKNAEMEREIVELRNQLAANQPPALGVRAPNGFGHSTFNQPMPEMPSTLDQYMGSHEAVASLLDLKSGGDGGPFSRSPNAQARPSRILEDVMLNADRIRELFDVFFTCYHPFLPLLEPDKPPDHYYSACPLLFWTIIAVAARKYTSIPGLLHSLSAPVTRLLWATIADVPQSYHIVKALCVLCTWPLPISSTSSDPTFMISGLMMQIAMQIGLHRPSHAQDFSKFKVELREEELRDRVRTWAACNMVLQRVATGYGQPSSTYYDWTLSPTAMKEPSYTLPDDVETRLRIEMFCDKVTKALYGTNPSEPIGIAEDKSNSLLKSYLARDLQELEETLKPNLSPINILYLNAAALHLHLSTFFDSPTTQTYRRDLSALYVATTTFLESAFNLSQQSSNAIVYATNYLLQMIIAGAFTLLKLLNSFFATLIDLENGKVLFTRTIHTIRNISVTNSDLPSRLAEVLAQLWRSGGAGLPTAREWKGGVDSGLQLKVRCRMSMSLVYDSVWRWREEFLEKGRGNLESALKNPTNPDSTTESSASSTVDQGLAPTSIGLVGGGMSLSEDGGFADWGNEVFDPLGWMLDGLVDLPMFEAQGLQSMEM